MMELSTQTSAPTRAAALTTPRMSVMRSRGLVGDSTMTSFTSGVIAASTAAKSVMSTFDTRMPCLGNTCARRRDVPP